MGYNYSLQNTAKLRSCGLPFAYLSTGISCYSLPYSPHTASQSNFYSLFTLNLKIRAQSSFDLLLVQSRIFPPITAPSYSDLKTKVTASKEPSLTTQSETATTHTSSPCRECREEFTALRVVGKSEWQAPKTSILQMSLFISLWFCTGFPGGSMIKNSTACRRHGFNPWVRDIPWKRKWQPTPVFLPGKSHGQSSLAGYWAHGVAKSWAQLSVWAHTSAVTEKLNKINFEEKLLDLALKRPFKI